MRLSSRLAVTQSMKLPEYRKYLGKASTKNLSQTWLTLSHAGAPLALRQEKAMIPSLGYTTPQRHDWRKVICKAIYAYKC